MKWGKFWINDCIKSMRRTRLVFFTVTVGLPLWKFLDFLVTHRPSLFLLLHTFIRFRVSQACWLSLMLMIFLRYNSLYLFLFMPVSLLWDITSCVSVFGAFIIRDLILGTKKGKRSVPQRCYDRDRGGKQCIKVAPFTLPVLVLWHCSRWLMLNFQVSIPRHCWPRLVCF